MLLYCYYYHCHGHFSPKNNCESHMKEFLRRY